MMLFLAYWLGQTAIACYEPMPPLGYPQFPVAEICYKLAEEARVEWQSVYGLEEHWAWRERYYTWLYVGSMQGLQWNGHPDWHVRNARYMLLRRIGWLTFRRGEIP